MALSKLSGDEPGIVFSQLCNVLDPRVAVYFSITSSELWALTQVQRQQLRADHEVAAALSRKMGMRSCKELREAKEVYCHCMHLSAADLAFLGTLGLVLPALKDLRLHHYSGADGPDGVQRLAEGLGAGALPAVTRLNLNSTHVGDAGASALAAALGRGALPRLEVLVLNDTGIGDAGLVALAPALRRLPALESLELPINLFGDEALAALVAPPLAGSPTGGLKKLRTLDFGGTQVTDAGCAAFAAVFESGALPVLTWTSICPRRISLMPYLCLWRYDALGSESEEYDESGSEEDEEDEEDEEEKEEEGGGGRRGQLSNPSGQQRETASLPAPRGGEGHQAPCTTAGTEKYRKPRRSSAA